MSRAVSPVVRTALLATLLVAVMAGVCGGSDAGFPAGACPECVIVAVDLDPNTPGFQTDITVEAGTQTVSGVTIWIYDPSGTAHLFSVGYVGGANRGIAFGHMPDEAQNTGEVVAVTATAVEPVIPGHTAFVNNGIQKMFAGAELQYFEYNSTPGIIPANPMLPVVTLDIELSEATRGDIYRFYLGDMTTVMMTGWEKGAFSSQSLGLLDSGGDAIPDGTDTLHGIDPDPSAPVPPASYLVDYVDGGGAVIRVTPAIPAVTEWGVVVMALLVVLAGTLVHGRPSPNLREYPKDGAPQSCSARFLRAGLGMDCASHRERSRHT